MDLKQTILELSKIQNNNIKEIYKRHGIKEPLFGIKISDLSLLAKKIKVNHDLSKQLLFNTYGNYDAMYLATMICDAKLFTKQDFKKLIKFAYCHEISNYIVAPILSKSDLWYKLCQEWIVFNNQYYKSAAFTCWSILVKNNKNNKEFFNIYLSDLKQLLYSFEQIHCEENWTKYSMNNFLINLGLYCEELRKETLNVANKIGKVKVIFPPNVNCKVPIALEYIIKHLEKK